MSSISIGTPRTLCTTSRSVLRSLNTGMTTESFMVSWRQRDSAQIHHDCKPRVLDWVLAVAMHSIRRESGQTKSDILRAARKRSGVANPFATVRDDGLSGRHVHFARFVLDPQRSPHDHSAFGQIR